MGKEGRSEGVSSRLSHPSRRYTPFRQVAGCGSPWQWVEASFQLEGSAQAVPLHFVDISDDQGRVLDYRDVLALLLLS